MEAQPGVPQCTTADRYAEISTVAAATVAAAAPEPTHASLAREITHASTVSATKAAQAPLPKPESLSPPACTPVRVDRLKQLLLHHPDQHFASFVVSGMTHGFHIGHAGAIRSVSSPNLPSAFEHSQFVSSHLLKCCLKNETAGPFDQPPFDIMQCSGVGVIPKKSGKLRLIHHLSSPYGDSVNDSITKEDFSLKYVKLDAAVAAIMRHGRGARMMKVDIKSAFRLCPVHPNDWHLLGIRWQSKFYFDKVLPFGLRSAPYLFDCLATAVEWLLRSKFHLKDVIHYLDDYLDTCGPSERLAQLHLQIILQVFKYLNIPIAEDKIGGPATTLEFLGMELDSVQLQMRLPDDKLTDLKTLVSNLLDQGCCTKRELASALGKLSFASQAIVPGRTFLRRLYDLTKATQHMRPHQPLKLSREAVGDLAWWKACIENWNGKSFFLYEEWTPDFDLELQTDASGACGWGAYYGGRWLQGTWSTEDLQKSIEYKELYAIVAACATWGAEWTRKRILFHCDNLSIVDCLKSGSSRSPPVMSLLRALFLVCAQHSFTMSAKHIPGVANNIADAISRGLLQRFRQLAPTARPQADTAVSFRRLD